MIGNDRPPIFSIHFTSIKVNKDLHSQRFTYTLPENAKGRRYDDRSPMKCSAEDAATLRAVRF